MNQKAFEVFFFKVVLIKEGQESLNIEERMSDLKDKENNPEL